jgi:DNA-binding NtrC family response regulator
MRKEGSQLKGKLLIVEADKENRPLIPKALKDNGYNCDEADGFQSAMDKLSANKYDLLLTEKNLPIEGKTYEGGIELIRCARLKHPDTTILLITSYPTVDSAIEAFKLGAFDYLFKPIDLKLLIQKVDRICEYRKSINPHAIMRTYLELNRGVIEAINGETVDINDRMRSFQKHLNHLFRIFRSVEHSLLDHRQSLAEIEECAQRAIDKLPTDNPLSMLLQNIADKAARRL